MKGGLFMFHVFMFHCWRAADTEEHLTMDANFLSQKFEQSLSYDRYLATGTDEQRRRWQQFDELVKLTDAQARLLSSFPREMKLLVVSGIWCGDCVQQVPLI